MSAFDLYVEVVFLNSSLFSRLPVFPCVWKMSGVSIRQANRTLNIDIKWTYITEYRNVDKTHKKL